MKKFYLSSKSGLSGISKYSRDFYHLILKEQGYIFIDSEETHSYILSAISSKDHVHIEIGMFQKKEIDVLFMMLKAKYKNVSITLHDSPLIKHPFFEFKNPFLNGLSRLYDRYANSFGAADQYVRKIKSIYVLSRKGLQAVKKRYRAENVHYLPYIIDPSEIRKPKEFVENLIHFGLIGKGRGIEYLLKLHQQLLTIAPGTLFYVVGTPVKNDTAYYEYLKNKYKTNVHYLASPPQAELAAIFSQAGFSLVLTPGHKYLWSINSKILYSMKMGQILLTNPVGATPEIIENGKTGFYLSGVLRKDVETVSRIISNKPMLQEMQEEVYTYLINNHSAEVVREQFEVRQKFGV